MNSENVSNEAEKPALNKGDVSGCLYEFLYNSCIYESGSSTISLHYSREGAEKAMNEHKQKALEKFNELYGKENESDLKFGENESWWIGTIVVLP